MVRVRHSTRRVALLVEWTRNYGRGILRGIGKYIQAHGRWNIYLTERKLSQTAPSWLKNWRGDGIIARLDNRTLATQIKQLKLPVVDLFEHEKPEDTPVVLTDNRAVVKMAAQHLLERGLTQFAYCGLPGIHDERRQFFTEYLAGLGYVVNVYDPPHGRLKRAIDASEVNELRCTDSMMRWLHSLPRPVGLMACNDVRAHQVLVACSESNLAVPEEIAVIGVDNYEMICGLAQPSLSSVELDPEEVGYQAAAFLDCLMRKETPSQRTIVVAPRGVVARQSTDVVAVADADVAAALHFIRQHACDGITVDDVLAHVAISRRTLERRFLALLGRLPKAEISRVQLGHVTQLLSMTDYPLEQIAHLTGFPYVGSMCVLFKKSIGRTPGQYRRDMRS